MNNSLRIFSIAFLSIASLSSIAKSGGVLNANGTTPRKYAAFPLVYKTDQGTLGAFSNATAVMIANYAFQQWAGVKSAAVSFVNGGPLNHDVTSASDPLISGSTQFSDGINPIIFDATGAITDAKLGMGASQSVIGFAGSAYSGNTYVEGYAIINGLRSNTGAQSDIDIYEAVITHEIGHFLGLGHSQVGMHADFATMYPVIEKSSQKILQPDDTTAIANLYPTAIFLATTGSITGTVKRPNGAFLSGVNVIAQDATTGASYSTVVDYYSGGKQGFDNEPAATGSYTFNGLHPGTYNVRIEPMNAAFTGGSSVASYYTPVNIAVAREWYSAPSETGDELTDNQNAHTPVTVTAQQIVLGANIISNESSTLSTLTYHNGTPYYIWSIPQSNIVKFATRFTAPAKGGLVAVQFRLDPSSTLPLNGTMTISVHQNVGGSLAGIPGAVIGSVTIPYKELAADQFNEVWLRQLGAAVNFDSLQTFHISISTNGVGSPVVYTDNGSPSQNRTSYQTSDGTWRNFPDGGWGAGYNLVMTAVYSNSAIVTQPTQPLVSLSPASLNFGQVKTRATLDQNVRLTNTGSGTLNVSGMSILGWDSLDFVVIAGGGAFSLAPSAYRDITIRFQPCRAAGLESATHSAKLLIASNSASSPDFVPLVGTSIEAVPLAVLAPIEFKRAQMGGTYLLDTGIVYNAGNDTLHIKRVLLMDVDQDSSFNITSDAGPGTLLSDSTYKVRLTFTPKNIRNYTATLRMEHDAFPSVLDIPIMGYMDQAGVPHVEVMKGPLELLPITPNPASDHAKIAYHVTNAGRYPVTLSIVDVTGKELKTLYEGTANTSEGDRTFTLNNLPQGTYYAMLRSGSYQTQQRFVVVR